jgi:hypothetical protein
LPPIIPDQADSFHAPDQGPDIPVTPISVPTRTELWYRVRLAQSLLSHRPPTIETAQVVSRVLDGWRPDDAVPA